jgi:hypothetical protein
MAERSAKQAQVDQAQMNDYVRSVAGGGAAAELERAKKAPRQWRDLAGGIRAGQTASALPNTNGFDPCPRGPAATGLKPATSGMTGRRSCWLEFLGESAMGRLG